MSSLKYLPIELLRCIVLALDNPSDLLHVALTCEFFYEVIIVTHHLHLTNIICCDSNTPLEFWQKLCTSPHYASMIRHLELRDLFFQYSQLHFYGQKVDVKFAQDLASGSQVSPVSAALSPQDLILKSLDYMDGLKYIGIHKGGREVLTKVYNYLRHVSKYFSNTLEFLHVTYSQLASRFIPQYKPSVCAFLVSHSSIQYAYCA